MRALLLATLVACGGGGAASEKPVAPKQTDVDEKQAEKDAKGLVEEIYETLGRGKKDNLFSLLDDSLIVLGPRKADALVTRTDALVALGDTFDPRAKDKVTLQSSALEVVASPGGRSAWAFDVIEVDGHAFAMTAILINTDDIWQVNVATLGRQASGKTIRAELEKQAIVPPGAMAKAKVDASARGAVERFQKGLLDQEAWGTDLASRSDAIFAGPAAGEVARGKKDIKKLWKKRVENKVRAATSGEITADTTPDGQLAWVSAPVTRVAEGEEPTPLRAFAVFEKGDDGWKMIALQESLAIDEPGAGASFAKIVPPKPDEPKVEEPPPEEPKPTKKKKKKKKKKTVQIEDE